MSVTGMIGASTREHAAPAARAGWRGDGLIALALGVAALALRLAFLGKDSLWGDEFDTWFVATQPTLGDLMRHVVEYEPHPPLYFLLMQQFLALAGRSDDFTLRLPSALAGALTVPVFYGLARLLFPARRGVAILAGALLALSPMHIYYSQEARAYALQILFVVAALAAFAKAWTRAETQGAGRSFSVWLCVSALLVILAMEVQYYSAFVWLAMCGLIAWAGWRQARQAPRRWAPALLILAVGMLHPAWSVVYRFSVGWAKSFNAFLPERYGPDLLFHVARAQLLGPLWSPLPFWAQVAGLSAGLVLLGLGSWVLCRDRRALPVPVMIALLGGVFTLGLPVAISFVRPIVFWGQRYLIIALPFVLLVLALGASFPWRLLPVRLALLGILLACQGAYLYNHYAHRTKHRWDAVGVDLARAAAGRTIYVAPDRAAPLLGRYMPPASRIMGANDPRVVARRAMEASPVFMVSYTDPRPALQRAGIRGPMTARVYEAYRPGQELWVVEVAVKAQSIP